MENTNKADGKTSKVSDLNQNALTTRTKLVLALSDLDTEQARVEIDALREWVLFSKPRFESAIEDAEKERLEVSA